MLREYIYVGIIIFLVISTIILVVLTQEEKKHHINIKECSKPKGEFAATAGYQTLDTIKSCGTDGKSICKFTVSNLKAAFNTCNKYPDKCTNFMYNNTSNTISFINDTSNLTINGDIDIYVRQS